MTKEKVEKKFIGWMIGIGIEFFSKAEVEDDAIREKRVRETIEEVTAGKPHDARLYSSMLGEKKDPTRKLPRVAPNDGLAGGRDFKDLIIDKIVKPLNNNYLAEKEKEIDRSDIRTLFKIDLDERYEDTTTRSILGRIKDRTSDLLDSIQLSSLRDFIDLKATDNLLTQTAKEELFSYENSNVQDQLTNRLFNFINPKITEAKNAKDITTLKEIRETVKGFAYESELKGRIDQALQQFETG